MGDQRGGDDVGADRFRADTLRWIGVGNVTTNLVAKRPVGVEVRSSARLAGGIIGHRIPELLTPQEVSIRPGDLLVIATDGIAEDHLDNIDFAAPAVAIAEEIVRSHGRDDDALVLTTRHRGAAG